MPQVILNIVVKFLQSPAGEAFLLNLVEKVGQLILAEVEKALPVAK